MKDIKEEQINPTECRDMKLVQLEQKYPAAGEMKVLLCHWTGANQAGMD